MIVDSLVVITCAKVGEIVGMRLMCVPLREHFNRYAVIIRVGKEIPVS